MTPTDMDQMTTPAEPVEIEPEPYSPPPAAPSVRLPSAWAPFLRNRERRWWTIALAATILITSTGIGILYVDDTNNQTTIRGLTAENESLKGHSQLLQDQLNTTQTNLTATLSELANTKAQLEHPNLGIWNVSQTINGPSWYLAAGIPDTFTYHLKVTSSGPISVSILTLEQWANANQCVTNGVGSTHYCMHHSGTVRSWLGVTSIDYDFHDAEGCADYMVVMTAASKVTVQPNVSVTYNPAPRATGTCPS
jgi:hypothetical protein